MKKDFLTLFSLERDELLWILQRAEELKEYMLQGRMVRTLEGKTLVMIFEKASTRTRLSFEIGIYQLGGYAVFLSKQDSQLGRGESVEDTVRVISRYADAIMVRTFSQSIVERMAKASTIPVINGLTDSYHPVQILADVFTMKEKLGKIEEIKVAYVGDGNNVAHSLINGAAVFGYRLAVATPPGFEPDEGIVKEAIEKGGEIEVLNDPVAAVKDARVVYTDVWVSMGQEDSREEKLKAFSGFQVNRELLSHASDGVMVLHCLPAHKGEEITEDVFEEHADEIFTQAENRLHVQKALMEYLIFEEGKG